MGERRELVEAVVQVGTEATTYLRSGRGRCAVVVAAGEGERLRLVQALSPSFRVVAPVLPPALWASPDRAAALAAWLRRVADGLGLCDARLVLGAELASAAGGLAGDGEWLAVVSAAPGCTGEELRRELEALG